MMPSLHNEMGGGPPNEEKNLRNCSVPIQLPCQANPEPSISSQTTDKNYPRLERNPLNLLPHAPDLVRELAALVTRDGGGDDRAAHTAGAAESDLGGDVDVGDWEGGRIC